MRRYLLDLMKEDFIVSQCTPVAVPIPVPFPDSGSLIPNACFSMRFQSQGCDVLLNIDETKADETVEGICIILSDISKATAFLR
mgnify:FL=1